jgi:CheY-like chemotaxis protein
MKTNPTRPILLVEDNPMDVDLTIRAFQHNHVVNPVTVLRDGEEALTYIRNYSTQAPMPMLVLLDLKLPRVDGLELLAELRKTTIFKTIPVVVLTSSSEDKDVQTAYQLGANSYIVKPVNFENFIEVAREIELYWVLLNFPPL